MKNMFYNYDHNINKKVYPRPLFEPETPDIMYGYSDMQVIYNIKGQFIGISGKAHNRLTFYFNLLGGVTADEDIKIENANVTVYNRLGEAVLTTIPQMTDAHELLVEISAEDNTLLPGIYRPELVVNISGERVTLFSRQDGILEIV